MGTRAFRRGVRFDLATRDEIEREIERGNAYYNSMILALNLDIAGRKERNGLSGIEGKARRIERLTKVWHRGELAKAKSLAAKAIYARIKKVTAKIRKDPRYSALESGCYSGTYHAVQADFERAVSSKRPGTWPGDPYRERRRDSNKSVAGVHLRPPRPWSWIRSGKSDIVNVTSDDGKIFGMSLKVSKSLTAEITVDRGSRCQGQRLDIPDDALVSHVLIARRGDYSSPRGSYDIRGKYRVLIIYKSEDSPAVSPISGEKIGVDIGWSRSADGGMVVAVSSDGRRCVIPAYAIRMALRVPELQAERDESASKIRLILLEKGLDCKAKSALGTADFVERFAPDSCAEYLGNEHELRCRQAHCQRRFRNIRKDAFRKFANELRSRSCILKMNLKRVAEVDLKGEAKNYDRVLAGCYDLTQLLRNAGGIEVSCERLTDDAGPTAENAQKIKEAFEAGKLLERPARKSVLKFRKSKKSQSGPINPMAEG